MNQKAVKLEDMTMFVPPLWEKDWDGAIRNATGIEEKLLKIQARAANLLRQINDYQVTFARLTWLNLWTKAFTALDGAVCALPKDSLYVLRMLARASFEQTLHAHIILQPVLKIYSGLKDTEEKVIPADLLRNGENAVLERLEAYTAWCIWNDQLFYEQIVRPETLNAAWDAEPVNQIAHNQKSLEAYEALYGTLTIETDKGVLEKGMLRQQEEGKQKVQQIGEWLHHTRLKPWYDKLHNDKYMTFFTLLSENKKSVKIPKCLKNFDLGFGYSLYSEGSMAIHGSSLDQFVHIGDKNVLPLFVGATDEVIAKAEEVGDNCNNVIVLLWQLCKIIWPDQSSSCSSDSFTDTCL